MTKYDKALSIIGKKAIITKDVQTENGMLYKESKVVIKDRICSCESKNNISIQYSGRRYWVSLLDILII